MVTRRKFTSAFKTKVAREAFKKQQTSVELAKRFEVSPSLICQWKNEILDNLNNFFEGKYHLSNDDQTKHYILVLEQKVEQLTKERDFLEQDYEKLDLPQKKILIGLNYKNLSINRKFKLIHLSKSQYYAKHKSESPENVEIMKLMDHQHRLFPTSGARTMRTILENNGYHVNIKRIIRLMKLMDIHAIYPQKKPN